MTGPEDIQPLSREELQRRLSNLTEANRKLQASLKDCARERRHLETKNGDLRYFLNKLPPEVVQEWFTEDEQRRFEWAGLPAQD